MQEGNVIKFHAHFELAQDSECRLPDAEIIYDGTRITSIPSTRCEFDEFKYLRMFGDSFPDLRGDQLKALKNVCLKAYRLEKRNFLIDINATNQWLRTVIGHNDLCSEKWTEASSDLISEIVHHSNIVPYDPYWPKRVAQSNRTNVMRVHFPSCVLTEALDEEKTLATKLRERMTCSGEACETRMYRREEARASNRFWAIRENEVDLVKQLDEYRNVCLVTWNGGRFIQKKVAEDNDEFNVVLKLSHPHIVYSFGELCGGTESPTYFMEYMSNDLNSFVLDSKRTVGENRPPFSPYDSVDVLLQIADAMKYMHEEDMVHCDLKSMNVLISEIAVTETVKHYLVKVADFGSARAGNSSSEFIGFHAGAGTPVYMAPEALRQLQQVKGKTTKQYNQLEDKTKYISSPRKIDVYSFGIVAFEVLTGDSYRIVCRYSASPSKFKAGVIEGRKRPLLRKVCLSAKEFVHDETLISLIESCWHPDPSERPSFEEICKELNEAGGRFSEAPSEMNPLPSEMNPLPSESSFGAFFRRFLCGCVHFCAGPDLS